MNKLEYDYLQDLKNDAKITLKEDEKGFYKVRVLHRGEQLYYQEGDKAFICEIGLIPKYILFTKSIKKWDDGRKITEEERTLIYDRIFKYFKDCDNVELELYNG